MSQSYDAEMGKYLTFHGSGELAQVYEDDVGWRTATAEEIASVAQRGVFQAAQQQQESSCPSAVFDAQLQRYVVRRDDGVFVWDDAAKQWLPHAQAVQPQAAAIPAAEQALPDDDEQDLIAQRMQAYLSGAADGAADGAAAGETKRAAAGRGKKRGPTTRTADGKVIVNNRIYVKGLPADMTVGELATFARRVGVILKDVETGEEKVRVYTDDEGKPKGDGAVTYLMEAAVDLALQQLDGREIRPGVPVSVERAVYDKTDKASKRKRGGGDARSRMSAAERYAAMKRQRQEALGWQEDAVPVKDEKKDCICMLFNVFSAKQAESDFDFADALRLQVAALARQAGTLKKVTVFARNPAGVVAVRMASRVEMHEAVHLFDGMDFGGRGLTAEPWDGVTNYMVKETAEDEQRRVENFHKWLDEQDSDDEQKA